MKHTFEVPDSLLVSDARSQVKDNFIKLFANLVERKRRELLCERDGHGESHRGVCDRCLFVVDEQAWDSERIEAGRR